MPKRPRQTDVAKLAGVSPATVSVILNHRLDGNVRISAATQARVLAAVEQLGYVTDPVARALAGGQNALLGIFTSDAFFARQQGAGYYPFLAGIEQAAAQHGYNLLLFTGISAADGHRHIYQGNLNGLRMADGAILLGLAPNNAEVPRLIADNYPFVLIGQSELRSNTLSAVAADYASATVRIVTEMLKCGHRRIAYLGAVTDHEAQGDRYNGYLIAHQRLGLTNLVTPAQRLAAQAITPTFLQQTLRQGITAFVLESADGLPTRFFQAMTALGKRAPVDFSLAILGDPITDFAAPYPVTSFTIPREAMGQRAVQLLRERLHTPQAQQLRQEILACTYAPGLTIAPPTAG